MAPDKIPKANQIRADLPQIAHTRSTSKALSIFLPGFALYCLTFVGIAVATSIELKFVFSLLNGAFVSILFIIGHDACHGSLTQHDWLNQTLGRLAFLPSLHPFTCWDLGHNRLHHSYTNLRGVDYVGTPFTLEEFRKLGWCRRSLERCYRTPLGIGLYYPIEIWWPHMIVPRSTDLARMPRTACALDRLSVLSFFALQVVLLMAFGHSAGISTLLVLGIVLPQVIWNSAMSFLIFLHHTHPRVVWYDNREEWSFYSGQVQGTVHVQFPWPIGLVLHNIMEHTAHHVDPRVPLYHLTGAQTALEQKHPTQVIHYPFSIRGFLRTLRACKLYDYENQRWLDFSGNPTTTTDTVLTPAVKTA